MKNSIFILKWACIIDALSSLQEYSISSLLAAIFLCLWFTVAPDDTYQGPTSRVRLISTKEEFQSAINVQRCFVFFFDRSLKACAEYAVVHAEISCRSPTTFITVDATANPEILIQSKVALKLQPAVVLFENGKETMRRVSDSSSGSLERQFWFKPVKTRFSL